MIELLCHYCRVKIYREHDDGTRMCHNCAASHKDAVAEYKAQRDALMEATGPLVREHRTRIEALERRVGVGALRPGTIADCPTVAVPHPGVGNPADPEWWKKYDRPPSAGRPEVM